MSLDRLIDPISGDVQSAPAGSFLEDDDLANKVIMSFSIPLGSWEGDPTFGHRLDELAREVDTIETRKRIVDLCKAAVQWLIDSGELASVDVAVQSFSNGIVAFGARCFQPGSSKPLSGVGVQYVRVGGA